MISILIPSWNVERYLAETLDCVRSIPGDDWECIVVDDGSTDGTGALAESYAAKDTRMRVIHKPHGGLASARNAGIAHSRGDYIFPLDGDDLIDPSYPIRAAEYLKTHENVLVTCCITVKFGVENGIFEQPDYSFAQLLCNNLICCCSCFRKKDLLRVGGYDESLKVLEDWDLLIRLLAEGGEVYRIPEPLFFYRQRARSLMSSSTADADRLEARKKIFRKHIDLYLKYFDCDPILTFEERKIILASGRLKLGTFLVFPLTLLRAVARKLRRSRFVAKIPSPPISPPMDQVTVSVIIPVYNTGEMLRETVRSVCEQTITDWELWLIDDGSEEETAKIAGSFTDARIHYFRQDNRGMAAARNRGIELARGRYLAFLDHDDLWKPDKLEKQLAVFQEKPETGLTASPVEFFFPDGRVAPQNEPILADQNQYEELLKHNLIKSASCIMIPRRVFLEQKHLRFRSAAEPCDDYDFYLRLLLEGFAIHETEIPLVRYRCHTNNASANVKRMNRTRLNVLKRQIGFIMGADQPFSVKMTRVIQVFRTILWLYRHSRDYQSGLNWE
ncbi:MAG: glycosyltransferase [Victivallaceae bacterium]|nr:glycosyltransferase [Victivallaceae bacterium]